jgi:hypothetical protein
MNTGLTAKAMAVMNDFLGDMVRNIAFEATNFAQLSQKYLRSFFVLTS